MTELQTKFTEELEDKPNEEISRLKTELNQLPRDLQAVAKTIKDLVDAGESDAGIKSNEDKYKELTLNQAMKHKCMLHLNQER